MPDVVFNLLNSIFDMNPLKHLPKIGKRDVVSASITKYIVVDKDAFNIGEFDNKIDAFTLRFRNPGSKVFRFVISELIK